MAAAAAIVTIMKTMMIVAVDRLEMNVLVAVAATEKL